MTNPTDNLEAAIVAAGANVAPRITIDDIEANIASEHYFTGWDGINGAFAAGNLHQRHADTDTASGQKVPAATVYEATRLLTFCILVLRNGFTVTGESAVAAPENFKPEIGRRIARENAVNKIWPLMGYELRSKLAAG